MLLQEVLLQEVLLQDTDSDENVRAIARFIHNELPTVKRYDLLAFNHTCDPGYRQLDILCRYHEPQLIPEATVVGLVGIAEEERLDFVRWSGLTSPEYTELS